MGDLRTWAESFFGCRALWRLCPDLPQKHKGEGYGPGLLSAFRGGLAVRNTNKLPVREAGLTRW